MMKALDEIEKTAQLLYVCLDCQRVPAGHPRNDPRDCCENCQSQNLWVVQAHWREGGDD